MNGTPDLDLLRLFVAVAEAASFSGAARRLELPKSSVSRGIARLEKSLGLQLLHRTTHTVALTTAGAALFDRVAPLVAALSQAVASVPEQQESPSGTLRLTAPIDFGATVLAELVPRFCERHPEVQVDARLTNAFVDLVAEGIDVALRISGPQLKDSTLVASKLGLVDLQLFATPGYLARRGMPRSPEELSDHDLVAMRGMKGTQPRGVSKTARVLADDFIFVREALRAGGGIGLLPWFLAHEEVARGTLVPVLPKYSEGSGTLYVVHPQMQHVPPKVKAFRDFVREQFARMPLTARTG